MGRAPSPSIRPLLSNALFLTRIQRHIALSTSATASTQERAAPLWRLCRGLYRNYAPLPAAGKLGLPLGYLYPLIRKPELKHRWLAVRHPRIGRPRPALPSAGGSTMNQRRWRWGALARRPLTPPGIVNRRRDRQL